MKKPILLLTIVSTVLLLITSATSAQDPASGSDNTQIRLQENDVSDYLWPAGEIWYKFRVSLLPGDPSNYTAEQKSAIRDQMDRWEQALTLTDSLDPAQTRQYISFKECDVNNPCEGRNYVVFRRNAKGETNNFCGFTDDNGDDQAGKHTDQGGVSIFHTNGFDHRKKEHLNFVLHELGHCIGLWHEHNRDDALRWLTDVNPDFTFKDRIMPMLGNYDYDSVMHYMSYDEKGILRFRDRRFNTFSREIGDSVSDRDISRVLQYYAQEHLPNWGFFRSLSTGLDDLSNPTALPDPYLAEGVEAVGTPSISYQSPGNYDIFVLGSDDQLYWKSFRDDEPNDWISLGWHSGSEPAAVSRVDGEIDLVAVEFNRGRLFYNHFENGVWGGWDVILDGNPPGGIKGGTTTQYIGPAVVARRVDLLDVFAVRADGLMAVTTLQNGNWSLWRTLNGEYNVTARPAAVDLSIFQVQLAVNESGTNLYEPRVNFSPLRPFFELGDLKGHTADSTPPALARRREDPSNPYRVLIANQDGRISHRFTQGRWRDIGGIPKPGSGPSAVAMGPYSALIVMNGEDAWSCDINCIAPVPLEQEPWIPLGSGKIQPGGLWLRKFEGRQTEIYYSFVPIVR